MVIAAVRGLLQEEPYKTRFRLDIYGWETPRGKLAQEIIPFGPDKHGFSVIEHTGDLLAYRPGHDYGRPEIKADLDRVLATHGLGASR